MKRLPLTIASLLLLALLVGFAFLLRDFWETPDQVRAKYAERPSQVLNIVEPITVSRTFLWMDGGTYGIELTDAAGIKHSFCLRHTYADLPDAKPPPNLIVGASHFSMAGARMVTLRGPEESDLYGVMLRWVDKLEKREDLIDRTRQPKEFGAPEEFSNFMGARMFFHRLDDHYMNRSIWN